MARPSKLSPEQWLEVERRVIDGESIRSLAREFCVSEGAIRQRVSTQTTRVKNVAQKLAEAQTALAELPIRQQYTAISLADKLRNISDNLAAAAQYGAQTAHRLSALANSEVAKVDDADPLKSVDSLKGVAALTKLANDSAGIALNLMAANKEQIKAINDEPPRRRLIDPSKLSDQALEELLGARETDA